MKIKTLFLLLLITSLSTASFAEGGFSSTQGYTGYSSTQSTARADASYYSGYSNQPQQNYFFKRKHFIAAVNTAPVEEPGPHWIDAQEYPIPSHAVEGGRENNPPRNLYICRASFQGGVHPGKIVAGDCNISWGGNEIRAQNYQILISHIRHYAWSSASYGAIPVNALPGGVENGRILYICQANWQGGVHPGKVVGNSCNFGYGGKEISSPFYNVLVAI